MSRRGDAEITYWDDGEEMAFARVDIGMDDLLKVKPNSRWGPDFFHPKYDFIKNTLKRHNTTLTIGALLNEPIIAPDHVRASEGEKIGPNYSVEYRTLKDLLPTGLNYSQINYCSNNAYQRLKRTELKVNDILFAGSGVGAIGRVGIVQKISKKSCVGDLFIIRNTNINQHYLYVYLLTEFGQMQIKKIFHGVQSAKISTDEIASIEVPIMSENIQKHIEHEYLKMSKHHDKAMEAHKQKNKLEYDKQMRVATDMLQSLISKTEEVIRGKRKDVI